MPLKLVLSRALLTLLPLAIAPSPARAQREVVSVNGWSVRDERGWCSAGIVHSPDMQLRIAYDAAADLAEFHVWNRTWDWVREGEAHDVMLRFSNGAAHRGIATRGVRLAVAGGSAVNGLWMRFQGRGFLGDFARAVTMEPTTAERRLGAVSLRGTAAMVQRLLVCAQSSARRYRSDRARIAPPGPPPPGGGAQVARPPVQRSGLITSDDYPAAALRAEEQGAVTVELTVSADGRVTGCSVRASSGSSILDSSTCALAVRRFRFTPATDAGGRPVAGSATRTVVWRIPEPPPVIEPKP